MLQSTHKVILLNNNSIVVLPVYLTSNSIVSTCELPLSLINTLKFWLCITLTFVIPTISISAQNISLDRKTKQIPSYFLKDVENEFDIDELLKGNFTFKPITDESIDDLDATYWILLDFKDELDTLQTNNDWRLRTLHFGEATLFFQKNNSIGQKSFGKFNGLKKRLSFKYSNGVAFKSEDLIQNRYLFLKVKAHAFPRGLSFQYVSNDSNRFFTHYYTSTDLRTISLHHFFLGACLIFFLTFAVVYFNVFRLEFLFYSLYVLFLGIYLGGLYISIPFPDTKFGYWIIEISQVAINLFYVLFAIYYLDTKKQYPELHILLVLIIPILIIIILAATLAFNFERFMLKHWILASQRFIMTVFGIISMLYLLFKARNRLAYFIVAGSFSYMVGALGFLFTYNQYLMILGAVVEILLFSWGLAYKINKQYESGINLQHELSLKEISSLQSQMNPHFIFNSLNSIQDLILKNDKISALSYISMLGKLTRSILESSHMTTVTLSDEISLLKSYLELESLRFDNSFDYYIEIDDNLDIETIEIPLMLIQPFVENALIHGLIGKKVGEKRLNLRFIKEEDYSIVEIEDNGIGRFCQIHELNHETKKSRGMEITKKRLKMLETDNQNQNSVEIIDKYDSNNKPIGTKIIIRIHNP